MDALQEALRGQVEAATGRPQTHEPVHKLKGDASNRSYYRVGSYPESYVVMTMPPGEAKKSEEASAGEAPSELPFLNVQRYLQRLEIRVPHVLRYDEPKGMMVLEDLGDVTFERALKT